MTSLSQIPSVHVLLNDPMITPFFKYYSNEYAVKAIRIVLDEVRIEVKKNMKQCSTDDIYRSIMIKIQKIPQSTLKRVINATGILIHTNLGRAPIGARALEKALLLSKHYSTVEFDLEKGQRGERNDHLEKIICMLTGAEAALVVNNNAAAVFLCLNTLAFQKNVLVSRGELVEIGNSFRIPEIMEKSGAILKEIGTTNKTRLKDYEKSFDKNTALFLKVHQSNYVIQGFTEEVDLKTLSDLSRRKKKPLLYDAGSGLLLRRLQCLDNDPLVSECVRLGCDLITFSGDKLMGGPQAGLIVGKKKYISILKRNPLYRAFRMDKILLSTLEETLRSYLLERPDEEIPLLKMIQTPLSDLLSRANRIKQELEPVLGQNVLEVREDSAKVGGGAMPKFSLPTVVLALRLPPDQLMRFEKNLRTSAVNIPVIGRIHQNQFILDFRTVFDSELSDLKYGLIEAYHRSEMTCTIVP